MASDAADTAKSNWGFLSIMAIVITALAVGIAGLYFSGQADDLFVYLAKKYYKAEAKAEASALEQVGEGQAEGFLKGMSTLRRNIHSCGWHGGSLETFTSLGGIR